MNTPLVQPTRQNPMPPDARAVDQELILEILKIVNCVRPGNVLAFHDANVTIDVQIAQQRIDTISPLGVRTLSPGAIIYSVPVYTMGGGGCTVTFPIKKGDECILLFNDREIDNWLEQGGINSSPTTLRLHDKSDAFALVGVRSFPRSLSGYSGNSAQLRSDDGQTYVDLNPTTQKLTMVAPTEILLQTPAVVVTGTLNVQNAESSATPCIIDGTLQATGDILANSGSISLVNHVHTKVQSGESNTGPATG